MLTDKQEKFAKLIVEGYNQSEAYRSAFPGGKRSEKTNWEKASVLARNPEVQERIKELRDALAKSTIKTAQERLEWLSRLIDNMEEGTGDKLRAIDIMNKMTGEYVTKVEADVKGEIDINIELVDD